MTPLPPDALAIAAQAIYEALPAGSGVNPIGSAAYPYPREQVAVVDEVFGGHRYADYYNANPVRDVSGLIEWTGPDSAQKVNGLTQAQNLAAEKLLAHGDDSFSADFHPKDAGQTGGTYTGEVTKKMVQLTDAQIDAAFVAAGVTRAKPSVVVSAGVPDAISAGIPLELLPPRGLGGASPLVPSVDELTSPTGAGSNSGTAGGVGALLASTASAVAPVTAPAKYRGLFIGLGVALVVGIGFMLMRKHHKA